MKIAAAGVLACVLVVAGCSASVQSPAAPVSTKATTSAAAPEMSSAAPVAVPSPDDVQTIRLLTALSKVDQGLNEDAQQSVTYARNVCQYIVNGDTAGAQGYAVSRAASDGITITDAQGAEVVTAVQATFCTT